MLRCDISRVLPAACSSRPTTSVPVKVLKMSATTASMVAPATPCVEMVSSESSLVSTKVLLISLIHRSCRSSLIRRRLVVVVMTLWTIRTGIARLLLVVLRILSIQCQSPYGKYRGLETYG